MTKGDKYLKQIEQEAGDKPPLPTARDVYSSAPSPVPRKKSRGYEYTSTGLDIKRQLTREEFRGELLPEIEAMQSRYQLIVGDAANHGLEYGLIESYQDMADLTGYTAGSIEVYASICRNIPQLTRVNSLKFKHYQVIAPLPADEIPHWISFAASNGLGYRAIDALIQWTEQYPQLPAEAGPGDNTTIAPAVDAPLPCVLLIAKEAHHCAPSLRLQSPLTV